MRWNVEGVRGQGSGVRVGLRGQGSGSGSGVGGGLRGRGRSQGSGSVSGVGVGLMGRGRSQGSGSVSGSGAKSRYREYRRYRAVACPAGNSLACTKIFFLHFLLLQVKIPNKERTASCRQ